MTSFSPRGPILRYRTKEMYFGIMDWMPGGLYFLRSYFSAYFQSAAFTFSPRESFIVKHRSICFGSFVKMYLLFLEIPYTTLNKCFKVHISTLRRNVLLLLGGGGSTQKSYLQTRIRGNHQTIPQDRVPVFNVRATKTQTRGGKG